MPRRDSLVLKMNNTNYHIHNINRKLLLVKILTNKKGKEIVDDILENDMPKLEKLLKEIK